MGVHIHRVLTIFLALAVCATSLLAQKPVAREYVITCSGMDDPSHRKILISALKDQDARALISIAAPDQRAKVRMHTALRRDELESACAPWGITIVSITTTWHPGALRNAPSEDRPDFPQYIDTGDPVHDAAEYDARKQAWLIAHPAPTPPGPDDH